MAKKQKKASQKLSEKLLENRIDKIIRLINAADFEKATSYLHTLSEKISDSSDFLAECYIYIAKKIGNPKIEYLADYNISALLNNMGVELVQHEKYDAAITLFDSCSIKRNWNMD